MDISAKVWRYTGEKWSRQSEELPLHRVIDLAILACESMKYFREESYKHKKLYDESNPNLGRIGLQGDAMTISVCTGNPMIEEDLKMFTDVLSQDAEILGERLGTLSRILKEMGY